MNLLRVQEEGGVGAITLLPVCDIRLVIDFSQLASCRIIVLPGSNIKYRF